LMACRPSASISGAEGYRQSKFLMTSHKKNCCG
jgi:hypothetical protein